MSSEVKAGICPCHCGNEKECDMEGTKGRKVEEVGRSTQEPWESDPRGYYTPFYNQFTSIIMISTFTGGVQAAVLSFVNDVLSDAPLSVELFPAGQHDLGSGRRSYSAYSLGLMLGLLAVSLNLTVAAVAAVNAALACHFSINPPTGRKPSMEARIVFCMIIQFIASGVAGVSLVLLCFKFDLAFSIVAAVLFFGGIMISGYHLVALFGSEWFRHLRGKPLHSISLLVATATCVVDVISPSPSSWCTISAFGVTLTYHMLAVLHNRSSQRECPRRVAILTVSVLSLGWIGCLLVTVLLGVQYRHHEDGVERALRGMSAAFSGMESLILGAISVNDFQAMVRWRRRFRESVIAGSGVSVGASRTTAHDV